MAEFQYRVTRAQAEEVRSWGAEVPDEIEGKPIHHTEHDPQDSRAMVACLRLSLASLEMLVLPHRVEHCAFCDERVIVSPSSPPVKRICDACVAKQGGPTLGRTNG